MIQSLLFRTVRARLLALMACIIIPIAATSIILAWTNYRSVIQEIEKAEVRVTSDFAVRSRLWFRGALRSVIATLSGLESASTTGTDCNVLVQDMLSRIDGFRAMQITFENGTGCFGTVDASITDKMMMAIADGQKSQPATRVWSGASLAETRYDASRINDAVQLVIYARRSNPSGRSWEASLVADPGLLDQAFELGATGDTGIVALAKRGQQVIVSRGIEEANSSWLPETERITVDPERWSAVGRDGKRHSYASQMVAEPDLYVLARFDDDLTRAAWFQFLVLCLTPLVTLAVLFFAYAYAIQNNIVAWIAGIEKAAKVRQARSSGSELAPVDPKMPADIRSVAEAFNRMVDDANQREAVLTQSIEANHFLMRELHHRVKNSLQVIQSYLALSRRQQWGTRSTDLAETEAKVQVLSIAYRLALTDGGMRPVLVRAFADEILGNLSSSLRLAHQWLTIRIEADAGLVVDRIIPLGLALVESVIAGLRADDARTVSINIHARDDGRIALRVTTDGQLAGGQPSPKIIAGLAAQLEAVTEDLAPGDILNWHFAA